MNDKAKTKKQLLEELQELRAFAREFERGERCHRSWEEMLKRYEFIVNTSREFLSLVDLNYTYVAVNDAYCLAHKRKREDIVNRHVSHIWGDDIFREVVKGYLDRCFAGKEVNYQAQFTFAASGVRSMDITYYPYFAGEGTVTHAVVVSRDITEQKEREKELLALKKAVETMQLGVTISDAEGKILYTNPAEANMHGYTLEELINGNVRLFAPKELRRAGSRSRLDEIKSWRREGLNVRKCGAVFPVQLMSDVVVQDGRPIGIITTCEDITERKRWEEQIRRQMGRLTILREIDLAILSGLDLRVTLNVLLNHLMDHLKVSAAVIMMLDPDTLTLKHIESRGFRSHSIRSARMRLGEGLAGTVALERRGVSVPVLKEEDVASISPTFLEEEDLTAYYGLPLIAKGHVKGTLEVFLRGPADPAPEWKDFIEALAGQAAIAIDNATLFDDLQRSNRELSLAYDTTLDGWSRALDLRDRQTDGHSRRVTEITMCVARAMGVDEAELVHVRRGAVLHDIGKMGIPDSILHKPGPLDDEEWEIMKRHPVYAYDMLFPISFLRPAIDIPYCHHEKWDGSGYPRGLAGNNIPLAARIFAVADVWDALRSARSYRDAMSERDAVDYIRSMQNKHFDTGVVRVFLDILKK